MRAWFRWAFVLCGCGSGCGYSQSGAGDGCTRSTQCKAGLACIEGACTDNLDSIEDPGTVPMLQPDAGVVMQPEDDAG